VRSGRRAPCHRATSLAALDDFGLLSLLGAFAVVLAPWRAEAAPLVYEGVSAEEAVARVQAIEPGAALEPLPWSELLRGRGPSLLGGGGWSPCAGAPTTALRLSDAVARARKALDYVRIAEARLALDDATAALGCLTETPGRAAVAQVDYLRGVAAALDGDLEGARLAFGAALRLDPDLRWDLRYSPDPGERLLREAREALPPGVALTLWPPQPSGLWIDGEPVATGLLRLHPGRHLLQGAATGGSAGWLELPTDLTATLLLPAEAEGDLGDLGDAGGRGAAIPGLLAAAAPAGSAVYVVAGPHVWRGVTGGVEWAPLRPAVKVALPVAPPPPRGRALVWSGAGLLAAGGLATGAYALLAAQAVGTCEEAIGRDPGACGDAEAQHAAALGAIPWTAAVGGAGLVLGGVGVVIRR
jgi:hypothetical protein